MNYGLKHLDLSWNCIRFKGAVGVAQGLKVSFLWFRQPGDCLYMTMWQVVSLHNWLCHNDEVKCQLLNCFKSVRWTANIILWSYCLGQAPQIYLIQILVLQKRPLCLICFAPYRSSAVPLFVSSGCFSIGLLYLKAM